MEKEKKRKKRINIYTAVVLLLFTIAFALHLYYTVFQTYNEKQGEIEVLQQKIKEEQEKNLKLKEYEKYMKSDAFVEEKAREEFNLIKDGEEVYILKKE